MPSPPDVDRTSGKASFWIFNTVQIPITKQDVSYTREMGKTTDSADYNATQDMLAHTQIPIAYQIEGSIEGRFRYSSTPGLIAFAVTSSSGFPCVLGLNSNTSAVQGHGLVDIFNLKVSVPTEDICTYTADIKSWGSWVPNA